jgi:hypothetical protein
MASQMQTPLNAYIIKQLSKGVDEDDLIFEICEKHRLNWEDGKNLVEKIKSENEGDISSRQLPARSILAVATLAIGLILVITTTIFLVDLVSLVTGIMSARPVDPGEVSIMGYANLTLAQVLINQSPAAIPLVAAGFINGLGMIFGSLLGMRETWVYLIDKLSSILWR